MAYVDAEKWFRTNTFHHSKFKDINKLVKLKRKKKLKISLAFPTLNEEETIGKEITVIKSYLMSRYPLIDEIAVIDSGSDDRTLEVARNAGAKVYLSSDILPNCGSYIGKGENLWKSLYVLEGDIIVWIDADIKNIHSKFVYGLVGVLLHYDDVGYVKAFYERPIRVGERLRPAGGGRVTEILIRPLLATFYPQLSLLMQPLSGEYAGRRTILENIPFRVGYGVETGHLLDIFEKYGLNVFAQVDMDRRVHRNQTLAALGKMSFAILQTFISRLKDSKRIVLATDMYEELASIKAKRYVHVPKKEKLEYYERPPIITIKEYRRKRWLD
jgi:glucosyl-3-phosphoglycerate synthase